MRFDYKNYNIQTYPDFWIQMKIFFSLTETLIYSEMQKLLSCGIPVLILCFEGNFWGNHWLMSVPFFF